MNFSNSGENKNDENVLIVEDERLARHYKGFFEYLWKKIPDKYLKQGVRAKHKSKNRKKKKLYKNNLHKATI